jgi:hypothetical protein
MSTTIEAAARWAATWERAWPLRDSSAIAALYAPGAVYRSHPHRLPEEGGAFGYTSRTFATESDVRCRFGDPLVDGPRAAVQWSATMREGDAKTELTLTGVTILTFDEDGLVIDHLDYWNASEGLASH